MTSYLDGIRSIASDMLEGNDVEARITHLANIFKLDRANVSAEVTDMVDVLRD